LTGRFAKLFSLAVFLFVLAILPYFGIWNFDYISLDDPQYITQNPQVLAGLSADSVAWAWTTSTASNWHPLSWLSHPPPLLLPGNAD